MLFRQRLRLQITQQQQTHCFLACYILSLSFFVHQSQSQKNTPRDQRYQLYSTHLSISKQNPFFLSFMASLSATATTSSHHHPPPFYFDEKWKLSKKEGSSRSSRSSSCPLMKSSSQSRRRCSFSRKCARLVKEQRARFYIVRRCVTMLICWNDYSDS